MTHFKRTPICAATALLTSLGASAVWAQPSTAPTPTPAASEPAATQTIEVSGIRKSIKTAEDIKRDALQVVDSINADDIGKFPDRSVGEALLPLGLDGENLPELRDAAASVLPVLHEHEGGVLMAAV